MANTDNDIIEENRRCRETYPLIYDELLAMLFRHDPISINFETNTDEYSPEVRTILPRLSDCKTAEDVLTVVYEEFTHWFGEPGLRQRYDDIAREIWELWRCHQAR